LKAPLVCEACKSTLKRDGGTCTKCGGAHLSEFHRSLLSKGATAKQAGQATSRTQKVLEGCGFARTDEITASPVANWLRAQREAEGGLSVQTLNHYLSATKSFFNWMVRDGRMLVNPLTHLSRQNVEADIRRERRVLFADELAVLVQETARSPDVFRGLDGPARAILYVTASFTGLRASELASLTRASFDFESVPPIVSVEAGYSKRRRHDVLPLHPDLLLRLNAWLACRDVAVAQFVGTDTTPLWPGTWPEKGAKMLRADLGQARSEWLGQAKDDGRERQGHGKSEFLIYSTAEGVADFHALRHTFITQLARSGVHPKDEQQLARHSTITLTMDRYSHVTLREMAGAVDTLPSIATPPAVLRVTGTDSTMVSDGKARRDDPSTLPGPQWDLARSGTEQLILPATH